MPFPRIEDAGVFTFNDKGQLCKINHLNISYIPEDVVVDKDNIIPLDDEWFEKRKVRLFCEYPFLPLEVMKEHTLVKFSQVATSKNGIRLMKATTFCEFDTSNSSDDDT